MSTVKMIVSQHEIVLLDVNNDHRFKCRTTITVGENNVISDVGGEKAINNGILYSPLKSLPMSSDMSLMFTKIVQHSLRELFFLRSGWNRFFSLAPKLEVYLSEDLTSLGTWFIKNKDEFGVRAVEVAQNS